MHHMSHAPSVYYYAATAYFRTPVRTALYIVTMVHPAVGALRPIMYNCITRRFQLCKLGGDVPPMNSVAMPPMNSVAFATYELGNTDPS